jgi:hypothetical protein
VAARERDGRERDGAEAAVGVEEDASHARAL